MNAEAIQDLRKSVRETAERGLLVASKWASELLLSIPVDRRTNSPAQLLYTPPSPFPFPTHHPSIPPALHTSAFAPLTIPQSPLLAAPYLPPWPNRLSREERKIEKAQQLDEQDFYDAALTLFEERSFLRAAHVLQHRDCKSDRAKFLNLYCQYLESEKNAWKEWHNLDQTRTQPATPINESLPNFLDCLEDVRDPYLLFLKALIIIRLSRSSSNTTRRPEAIQCLLSSLAQRPWNWSAWTLLSQCIESLEELLALMPHLTSTVMPVNAPTQDSIPILPPHHPTSSLFALYTRLALHASLLPYDAEECERLLLPEWFPENAWIKSIRAGIAFSGRDYAVAHQIFANIHATDPYRIDNTDILGNVLFVTNSHARLAGLAMEFINEVDQERTRPEVCCLVGIHYSFRAEHEKALKHLRRAVELDRTDINAWVIMGQQYGMLGNAHAAIQCYRRALDVTARDYRAWLGLGKSYSTLGMWAYAQYYYVRAMQLRPGDWRVWIEQAFAYDELNKPEDALRAAKYAQMLFNTNNPLCAIPNDPTRTNNDDIRINSIMGALYKRLEDIPSSINCHQRVIDLSKNDPTRPIAAYALSLLDCAEWESKRPDGDWVGAQTNCEKVLQAAQSVTADDVTRAQELSRILKAKIREGRMRR